MVRIRQATMADLTLLLEYRRAMVEEMGRWIGWSEPQDLVSVPLFRRTGGIPGFPSQAAAVPSKSFGGSRVSWTQPRDVLGFTAFMPSSHFGDRGIGRQLTQTIIAWCRERGFEWIYLHASDQGRPLYQSLGFVPSSEMRLKL